MLTTKDLPKGWENADSQDPGIKNAKARLYSYGYTNPSTRQVTGLSHMLIVYADPNSAKDGYAQMESEWFPSIADWDRPKDATFKPSDPADQFRLGCQRVFANTRSFLSCGALQQHNQLVSLLSAQVDGEAITLNQLEEALKRLDMRLNQQ